MAPRKFIPKKLKYTQGDLFKSILKQMYLIAPDSPKKAFYNLSLEFEFNQYFIRKESGFGSKILDSRKWEYPSLSEAEKSFNRRIKQKTRPDRKSPRHYIEVRNQLLT